MIDTGGLTQELLSVAASTFDPLERKALHPVFLHLSNVDGFVVVYSVTSQPSFLAAKAIVAELLGSRSYRSEYSVKEVPLVLVGTKADLFDEREVSTEQGLSFAASLGCQFFEVQIGFWIVLTQ